MSVPIARNRAVLSCAVAVPVAVNPLTPVGYLTALTVRPVIVAPGMRRRIALRTALTGGEDLETALTAWSLSQTAIGNRLVQFGNQLGQALVRDIPDWSGMNVQQMAQWFNALVTINTEVFDRSQHAR